MSTYAEKLKDPRWQKKRLEIFNRDNWQCLMCGSPDDMLTVHHLYYMSGRMPWDYPNSCFKTLCSECHKGLPQTSDDFGGGYSLHENVWGFFSDFDGPDLMDFYFTISESAKSSGRSESGILKELALMLKRNPEKISPKRVVSSCEIPFKV